VLTAMDDPHLAILGHPTGRLLLQREPYAIDLEQVLAKAASRGIAVEVNADPHRLDLDWRMVRRARELGVTCSIGADAHSTSGMANVAVGLGIARKGWLEPDQVPNTRDAAALFARCRAAQDYAGTDPKVLEQEIHSTGFFRNKTKSIIGMAQALIERHGGTVPDTMEQLVQLPGVGRKTANVVLGTWFGKNEGIVVDTHVQRLATLLGLTKQRDPVKIERDLVTLVPRDKWTWFSHTLIRHG